MTEHTDGTVDEPHTVAVSDLRSRFEQLAVDNATTTPRSVKRLSSGQDHLAPESFRPRASSATEEQKPLNQALRAASSSSDLKKATKRPPPIPPSRSPRASSPNPSASTSHLAHNPRVTGMFTSPSASSSSLPIPAETKQIRAASLARKPPPPPPPTPRDTNELRSTGRGVGSLSSKFG